MTLLKAQCPSVFADFAKAGTAAPWVTYQHIGGQALRYVENTPAAQRHTLTQITVWHTSRSAALALIRQIEEALCASSAFTARPAGEPTSDAEPDLVPALYGSMQDFDIWSAR